MSPVAVKPVASGVLTRIGISAKRWISSFTAAASQITEATSMQFGGGSTTIGSLLGGGKKVARSRQEIYQKWAEMESDPVVSTALGLLVTAALGGHETSGDLVFLEKTAGTKKDPRLSAIVDEISADLVPIFNKVAVPLAYTGAAFGDSYARIYANADGVIDLCTDEMFRPPMVQPFERGSRTVGYAVYSGPRNFERLDVTQLARLKMPRTQWVPQYGVVEKSLRVAIMEDDIDKLPVMPAMAGGSLLYNAEDPYEKLNATLLGLVSQRWRASLDHRIVGVQLEGSTVEQQERFLLSVVQMYKDTKKIVAEAIASGTPITESVTSVLPMWSEKQLINLSSEDKGGVQTITIEDVMLHARLLSGAIGVDLSMIGFADQLSGGLGDGGFFRLSAQAAERARTIRVALAEFFNQVVDIHTLKRYGMVFPASERPWAINFYGSISALEAEKQRTKADSMSSGMMLVQAMQAMKDLGASKEVMSEFLAKTMMLDEDQAKLFATILDAKPPDDGGGAE